MERVALQAQAAADRGDHGETYCIARQLAGIPPRQLTGVLDKQGEELLTDPVDVQKRWTEHFAEVLGADVVENWRAANPPRNKRHQDEATNRLQCKGVSWEEVDWQVRRLPPNKGVGPDGLPSEVLKAALCHTVCFLHTMINDMLVAAYFPRCWRGGHLATIWKRKASATICDNSRGILLADHAGKAMAGVLQSRLLPTYEAYIPRVQFGACRGRSTLQAAAHTAWFLEAAGRMERSAAVLFLDLEKAFDYALRETLLGWTASVEVQTMEAKCRYLEDLGLERIHAREMAAFIDRTGGILREVGVDIATASLTNSLHDSAWAVVKGGLDESENCSKSPAIISKRGGRQGCKLGAMVFNFIYACCLKRFRERLLGAGLVLHLKTEDDEKAFWSDDAGTPHVSFAEGQGCEVVEATFVDDEEIYLTAATAHSLSIVIDTMLECLDEEFRRFAFRINYAKGKTELMVIMRGKSARRVYAEKVVDMSGQSVWLLPDGSGCIHTVDVYKHVGTKMTRDGTWHAEISARTSQTMTCYAPLASSVFGNRLLSVPLRMKLAKSLLMSRLFLHAALWTGMPDATRAKLSRTYMTVLRRIHGSTRGSGGWKVHDTTVLIELDQPCLDDVLASHRLKSLSKIVSDEVPSLVALLRVRSRDGRRMAWAEQVQADLREMARRLPHKLASLGNPINDADAWLELIRRHVQEWKQLVDLAFGGPPRVEAKRPDLGSPPKQSEVELAAALPFQCSFAGCHDRFATNKAARQHERIKHGTRTCVDQYVGSDGKCPICSRVFASRLRAVAHLSDPRIRSKHGRPSCRERVLSGEVPPIHGFDLIRMREEDRKLRAAARRDGHTTPIVGFARHACAPKQAVASQRPKRRLPAKTAPGSAEWVWTTNAPKRRRRMVGVGA